jgi:ABC-type multidrug transport system ATPase subunit
VSAWAVELQGVGKRYGARRALDAVTLRVEPGQVFGLIGPNGAGKTTTFSLLCGYLFPSEGQVRVLGVDPGREGVLKGKVGALPHDAALPPGWEVGELLTYWARLGGLGEPSRQARQVLEEVELAEAWRTRTGALSHGMARRVALAQALLGRPPLLLLDEPTAGLDPRVAAQVRARVSALRGQGRTVLVSSHNLSELEELCDAAAILDRGRLAQAGSLSELTGRGAVFRVQVARGEVPLEAVRLLEGIREAGLEVTGVLTVHFDGARHRPEEVISRTVGLLLQHGVLILGVTQGQRLEQRVLELL